MYKASLDVKDFTGKTSSDYIAYMDDYNLQAEVRHIVKKKEIDNKGLFRGKCCAEKK